MTGWIIILISATKASPIHFRPLGELGEEEADGDAQDDGDDDGDVEVVRAVPLGASPCRMWRSCSCVLQVAECGRVKPIVGGVVTPVTVVFTEFMPRSARFQSCTMQSMPWSADSASSPIARQIMVLQLLVVLVLRARSARAGDPGRTERHRAHRRGPQPWRWRESVADSPVVQQALRPRRPSTHPPAVRRAGARRHRRGLRRRDGAGPHPVHPSRPQPDRQARSSVTSGRARGRGLHPGVHRNARLARSARSTRCSATAAVVALVSVGITLERHRPAGCSDDLPRDRRSRPLGTLARGAHRRVADQPTAAATDARHGRARDHADVRVLPSRPAAPCARGCSSSTSDGRRAAGQRGGRSSAGAAATTVAGSRWTELGLPPALVAAASRAEPRPTTRSTRWASSVLVISAAPAYWNARRGRSRGDTARPDRAAGWSPASSTWCAASPSRCARRTTSRPTGCTRSCRSIEMGHASEAVEFATASSASRRTSPTRSYGACDEPVLAALLLGKSAQAAERGIELVVEET